MKGNSTGNKWRKSLQDTECELFSRGEIEKYIGTIKSSTMKLKNKNVVVTGAGSGIGRACAIEFAKEGANLIIADVNITGAEQTLRDVAAYNVKATICRTDVSKPDSVMNLVDFALARYNTVDVLVNNAAIQVNKSVEETSFDEWTAQLSVNLSGVFLCSKHFLPHLRKTKGNIVNMSSVNAFFVEPTCAGYCATKAAIIGFTKAMAIDHGKEGIRVNCICPGYIDAGLAQGYFDSQTDPASARMEAGKLHALARIGRPEEIGRAAVFLASDDASFVTGTALVVDGGFGSGLPPR
jgi:NAD(P)-dependent dehydrogenase (short-subunit alcohol dehydrogenase family)